MLPRALALSFEYHPARAIVWQSEKRQMITTERSSERLVLKSGPTTVVLDKVADKAILERTSLLWAREPAELPLSWISGARVSTSIDDGSKAEICSLTLVMREGDGWVLSAKDKQDAAAGASTVRDFLGIAE
jgi:hypothetical protein